MPRAADFRLQGVQFAVVDLAPTLTAEQLADAARTGPPATDDDVSITQDGRRLTSRENVLEFLAELDAQRGDRRDAISA